MLARQEFPEDNNELYKLRAFIKEGGFEPGDRLPSERKLIDDLGVTRSSLRKALDTLEREGAIWRHVGKGTFVGAKNGSQPFPHLAELSQQLTPIQMMRARLSLEPAITREAAVNASADAVGAIITARDKAHSADGWDAYEEADDLFHRCIAQATGNLLLLSVFDHLNHVRRAVAWRQVIRKSDKPSPEHSSFAEHDLIVEAITDRDPAAAYSAMHGHLTSVSNRLYGVA